ncbi:hypothetical protein BD626DRAFT_565546 [Schizophyllum amplum]|uniref:Uncharacterized protein n=1 Tax=Schizophyllum amplum TaxID=97359 RepID=A0A550CVB7_9AGAR|nr:hypothetical protein BD626DRAFT_565546 [Auriculariopsis ampla]
MPADKKTSATSAHHMSSPYNRESAAGSTRQRTGPGHEPTYVTLATRPTSEFGLYYCSLSRRLLGRGTAHEILECIDILRSKGGFYSMNVDIVCKSDEPDLPKTVVASRLEAVTFNGNNSNPDEQTELQKLLNVLHAPDLKKASILRPGNSTGVFERAVYDFLMRAGESEELTLVILSMKCCYRSGLTDYLRSSAAGNLVSLFLQTNAYVEAEVLSVLPHKLWLSSLKKLVLRNADNIDPDYLLEALEKRHQGGLSKLRSVKITATKGLSARTIARGRAIGIEIEAFHSLYKI